MAPYVSNEERIRLGVHQYGSDVPQEALDAAVAALAGSDEQPAEEIAAEKPPKRARTRRGQSQPDNPATPDVNEAWEAQLHADAEGAAQAEAMAAAEAEAMAAAEAEAMAAAEAGAMAAAEAEAMAAAHDAWTSMG